MTASDFTGQLTTIEAIKNFVLAGNATITIRNPITETRFTYRIRTPFEKKHDNDIWFVSILTGPDNNNTYQYIGQIRDDLSYDHGHKSRITAEALSTKAFNWFWRAVRSEQDEMLVLIEVWHEGRCGRCGRKLTVPESVESGFGPDCIQHIGLAA